eukprot:CAMPEP_0177202852 /NCGR_PEP_ID=MMETSP0367-20130122/27506_1 /TAXON_ID=447022 ORGANISM="Scrippsiella hangoei-like, Strain SHHI-4" /NCGR_SAMPLE_ID=MMETSP0367 /ASSEMBLY_ACC=CAM_ASM_000362 /LENGTH=185 /DNA_ID=CAMNT_0018651451 /DNA_START=189 /DNA_END=746 /DNA_ORIENTATION=+
MHGLERGLDVEVQVRPGVGKVVHPGRRRRDAKLAGERHREMAAILVKPVVVRFRPSQPQLLHNLTHVSSPLAAVAQENRFAIRVRTAGARPAAEDPRPSGCRRAEGPLLATDFDPSMEQAAHIECALREHVEALHQRGAAQLVDVEEDWGLRASDDVADRPAAREGHARRQGHPPTLPSPRSASM